MLKPNNSIEEQESEPKVGIKFSWELSIMTGSAPSKDGLNCSSTLALLGLYFTASKVFGLLVVLCMRLLWFASLDSTVL